MQQLVHFDVCAISTHFASKFFMQNASTLPTHFVTQKNQNVPIVTLVQNALYQGQHILHQCNNWYILNFLLHSALASSTHYVTLL